MKIHTVHLICRQGYWTSSFSPLPSLTMHKPAYQLKYFSLWLWDRGSPVAPRKQCRRSPGHADSPDGHWATRCGRLGKPACSGAAKQGGTSSAKAACHILLHETKCPSITNSGSDPGGVACFHVFLRSLSPPLRGWYLRAVGLGGTKIWKLWQFFFYL